MILSDELVLSLKEETTPREYLAVVDAVERYGGTFAPMHPGEEDPSLSRFFVVDVPDASQVDEAARALADLEGVEAAYVKPPDALP